MLLKGREAVKAQGGAVKSQGEGGRFAVDEPRELVRHLAEELDADEADFEFVVVVSEVFHCVCKGI